MQARRTATACSGSIIAPCDGFTIVELMVSVTVMLLVTAMVTGAYIKIARVQKVQGDLTEAGIEFPLAVERIRYDLEMAGFGLPRNVAAGPSVGSAVSDNATTFDPSELNDAGVPPSPVSWLDNEGKNGSDVLAVRAMYDDPKRAEFKWTALVHEGGKWFFTPPLSPGMLRLSEGDRFVILSSKQVLLGTAGSAWFYEYPDSEDYYTDASSLAQQIQPVPSVSDVMYAFSLGASDPRTPWRRVDYYLDDGDSPRRCAPGTLTLYRAPLDASGHYDPQPVLFCVLDFQAAFGLDTNGDGAVDSWGPLPPDANGDGSIADEAISQVKEVRVFILTHEGSRDEAFSYASTDVWLGDSDTGTLSVRTVAGSLRNYRWKPIRIAVKPANFF